MSGVTLDVVGHVGHVRFANGPANYFTRSLLDEIADTMERARGSNLRALVLSSEGRHFCAGADFSSIGSSVEARSDVAARAYAAGLRIYRQPLPVVAAMQGAAIGGGLGLACTADFRVVAPDARLEANFTRLGFHPGFGLSVALPWIVGHQAAHTLLLRSQQLSGTEAVAIGLADRVADADDLIDSALELATEIGDRAPLAVQAVRSTLRRELVAEVEKVLAWEAGEQRRLWATEDAEIGMSAAQQRAKPTFVGR